MSFKKICFLVLAGILVLSGIMVVKNSRTRHISNQGTFVYLKVGVINEKS